MAFWNQYHPQQTKWDMLAIGPFRVVKWKSCMSFLCGECSLPIHQMGGTLSKTKKVDFLNGPSYWKWCVWDGQCFGSFEVKLHVNILLNFETILARYQLTCPQPLFNSELDLPLPLFQDDAKPTQAKAAVEAAQEDWFCWVKTAGWLGCTQLAGYFFKGPIDSICDLFESKSTTDKPSGIC